MLLTASLCINAHVSAQSLSPKVIATAGCHYTDGGKTFNTSLLNGNFILAQGEQQPYILLKILNLRTFIEGYFINGGQMQAALYNTYPLIYPSDTCDSIRIELHASAPPYNLVASSAGLLHTDGNASIRFPLTLMNGSYYIVLHHRNAIETWSKNTVSFNASTVSLDFTAP